MKRASMLFIPFAFIALVALAVFPGSEVARGAAGADNALCAECHEEIVTGFHHNVHGRIRPFEVGDHEVGCVSCHPGAEEHAEAGGDPEALTSYAEMTGAQATAQCMTCHKGAAMAHWSGSAHAAVDLGCLDCHSVHAQPSGDPGDRCAECHDDVQAEMHLPSHHPVGEGKMDCQSCHDPHGTGVAGMVKSRERLNDLCLSCHSALQGPFIFEHPPAVEDCLICHRPHGSVADNLLTENEPFLCLQCHEMHFHTGARGMSDPVVVQRGTPWQNPHGTSAWKRSFATACTQCHPSHHGTDLPSQGVTSQGKALTR